MNGDEDPDRARERLLVRRRLVAGLIDLIDELAFLECRGNSSRADAVAEIVRHTGADEAAVRHLLDLPISYLFAFGLEYLTDELAGLDDLLTEDS